MNVLILHERLSHDARPDERDVLDQVDLVRGALLASGETVEVEPVAPDLGALERALAQRRPDVVFNLVESLGGRAERICDVPALLARLGLPFTGSPSGALAETSDKLATKARLRALGLPTPDWLTPDAESDRDGDGAKLRTWIAKPVLEDGSVGIDDAALFACAARDVPRELRARQLRAGRPLFAEAYIDGREINLSLLAGASGVQVLPAAEILFEDFPPDKPRIVGYAAKWESGSFEYTHTPRRFVPFDEAPALTARLGALARAGFEQLGLRGYARIDFRVDSVGAVWILEVNANPCLAPDAGFLAAAARAGLTPAAVVTRLLAEARAQAPDVRPQAAERA